MALKLKTRTQFPASVSASSPVTVTKTGLAYTFGLDVDALMESLDPFYLTVNLDELILNGATSGTVTVQAPAVAGARVVTMPAATDTLVGKATTDIFTNKTIDTAGPNTIKINGNTLAASAGTETVTIPNATDTLVGKATTDELTNKTLTTSVAKGTWTASGTWTIPAVTLGGTVSGGGNQLNNVIIGTSTPLAGAFTSLAYSTTITGTSANASALAIGLTGATNPAFKVDASTASQAAGLSVTGAVTGGTVAVAAIDSGAATNLTINAKGSGTIGIGSASTGIVTITPATNVVGALTAASATATPAGGSTAARLLLGTTAGFGIYYGSGAPTVSAAAGSLYIRTDNAGANLRLYSNTTGSTTWAAITSA